MDIRSTDLQKFSQNLNAAAREIDAEVERAIKEATRPLIAAARAEALRTLPSRGGLSRKVAASQFSSGAVRTSGGVGYRVSARNKYNISSIDKGRVRHPVFGNRKVWARQGVNPGWFSEPAKAAEPRVNRAIRAAMERTVKRVERGL